MALFKSDEQKALEYARKQQQAADKQYQEFLTTPVGQAVRARDEGQGFVEIQLAIGTSRVQGGIHPLGNITATSDTTTTQSPAGTLAAIEEIGWHLEHVGYVFVQTSQDSTDKTYFSGQQTAINGQIMGIYLFRRHV